MCGWSLLNENKIIYVLHLTDLYTFYYYYYYYYYFTIGYKFQPQKAIIRPKFAKNVFYMVCRIHDVMVEQSCQVLGDLVGSSASVAKSGSHRYPLSMGLGKSI
jgi:hypothetical protein